MNEPEQILKLHEALLASSFILFPEQGHVNRSNIQGVYIIFNPNNEVCHIGTTKYGKNGVNQRLNNHLKNQSSFSKQFLKKNGQILREGYQFKYIEEESGRTRALLEALSIGLHCPAHIGTGEKMKS